MSMKRYKPEQIVTVLRQIEVAVANGKSTPQACTEAGIRTQTYDRWRKEYGGLLRHSNLLRHLTYRLPSPLWLHYGPDYSPVFQSSLSTGQSSAVHPTRLVELGSLEPVVVADGLLHNAG